ncbi:MAG: helix-turn-helix domain-containing protein [Actinomycetota bacterium]|nr:helix-turn-helix domain-containing protein [Actinomycetota bacterium]
MILPEFETCYRAVSGRDARFDGWFFTAVRTTGIYCRPSCPAITPLRRNVEFHPSAASAQRAGFRACKRCRPDASPGSPEWDARGDLAGRALRLIADGVIDRDGVPGLARRLGYSERQVNRTLVAEVGAGPLALARAQRAQTARILLETTNLPSADVAFAAGFASVRQFNETIQAIFASTPTGLHAKRARGVVGEPGLIRLRLPYRAPMDVGATLDFLGRRAIAGVESYAGVTYSRVLRAPCGPALVSFTPAAGAIICKVRCTDQRDLVAVVSRVRHVLDLDADPESVDELLGADTALAPLVAKRPGLRSPGAVDGFEMAVRAVVGQQISLAAAAKVLARICAAHGTRAFEGEPWMLFPDAVEFAALDPAHLPMPAARAMTLIRLAEQIANGDLVLDPGADRDDTRRSLLAVAGVGAWTADYLRMRALGDPDVALVADLGVRKSATALGLRQDEAPPGGRWPEWAPWRSYATHHLWAARGDPDAGTDRPRRNPPITGQR